MVSVCHNPKPSFVSVRTKLYTSVMVYLRLLLAFGGRVELRLNQRNKNPLKYHVH